MKINSNTIKLEKESFEKLETIIKKIASENKIENVESIQIKLSKEQGIIRFKNANLTKDQMLQLLNQKFPKGKFIDGEDWGGEEFKNMIVASGEEGYDDEGMLLFDYHTKDYEEKYYIMGTNKQVYELLESHDWGTEWYDPGTMLLYPISEVSESLYFNQ
jgi:hypothetical protein